MSRLPSTGPSLLRYLRQQNRVVTRLANSTPYALSGTSVVAPGLTTVDERLVAGTPGGSRVELDSAGLRKYAADGTTVQVDLTGDVAAFSGLITGSEIVGGEIKTALTGPRVHVKEGASPGAVDYAAAYLGEILVIAAGDPAATLVSAGSSVDLVSALPSEGTPGALSVIGIQMLSPGGALEDVTASTVSLVGTRRLLGLEGSAPGVHVTTLTSETSPATDDDFMVLSAKSLIAAAGDLVLPFSQMIGFRQYNAEQTVVIDGETVVLGGGYALGDTAPSIPIVSVWDTAALTTLLTHVTPSASEPLLIWKRDAATGEKFLYTEDGTTFAVIGGGGSGGPLFPDPGVDRLVFWDHSVGAFAPLTPAPGLQLSGTILAVRAATSAETGIVEFATPAETITGLDGGRATTPAGVKAAITAPGVSTGVSYSAGWANYGGGFSPATWYKDKDGFIRLSGLLLRTGSTITNAASGTIFTLPVGARPAGNETFIMNKGGEVVFCSVGSDGIVQVAYVGTWTGGASFMYLGGCQFKAA